MRWKGVVFVCLILALGSAGIWAQSHGPAGGLKVSGPLVVKELKHDLSPPLREMVQRPDFVVYPRHEECNPPEERELQNAGFQPWADGAVQTVPGNLAMPAITQWEGLSAAQSGGYFPPDTEGDVGADHYVQWVNVYMQIWDKAGNSVWGPHPGNYIWQGFGGPCDGCNDGDPIVLYDRLDNRWIISQFALTGGNYQYIAVSATSDPTGSWYRYAFDISATKMNDYPKFGVWTDGYYYTCHLFGSGGMGVGVFEKSKMMAGLTATLQFFDLEGVKPFWGMLPGHFEGMIPPPAGAACPFAEVDDSSEIGPSDAMRIWNFHVDWATPANTTFGDASNDPNWVLPVTAFTPFCPSGQCIQQPGTAQGLDDLADRLMYKLIYRNYGDHEALVMNRTVDAGSSRAGIRWFEVRKTAADWSIFQEGTYAPADTEHRWMGSIGLDHVGNIAMGYSVSSGTVYPSIRIAGRLASDPAGVMGQGEASMMVGTGSQTGADYYGRGRWGDYSTISIDPADDCTFWYTTEYMQTTSPAGWQTRIGYFKYPNCSVGPTGTLTGTVTASGSGTPIVGANVSATDGIITLQTTTGAGGTYTLSLPVATYSVTASAFGYSPATANGVVITDSTTTTQDFSLVAAATHTLDGTVTDSVTTWPLYASIHITGDMGYPGTTIYTNPADGTYSITLVDGVTYALTVTPWVSGYTPGAASVGPLAADVTQDFALSVTAACNAPGYALTGGFAEHFESWPPPGWTIVDNAGGLVWNLDSAYGDGNYTGGAGHAADVNSDANSGVPYDTELRTPSLNFTTFTGTTLTYQLNFQSYSGIDYLDVDISTNGGSSWTNLRHFTSNQGTLYSTPGATDSIDLSSYAAQTNVILRWRYYTADTAPWDWYAQIDDVAIGTPACNAPAGGGLIYGNVYDANTMAALSGATVSNSTTGGTATTAVTPDPNVDDGFYCMYGAEGANAMSATKTLYGTDSQSATVPHFGVVQRDFQLGTGHLTATPASLSWTTAPGGTGGTTVTLNNIGGVDATFTVKELNGNIAKPSNNLFALSGLSRLVPKHRIPTAPASLEQEKKGQRRAEGADTTRTTDSPAPVGTPGSYVLRPKGKELLAPSILAYVDEWQHTWPNTYPEQALTRLGFGATIYHDGDYAGFEAALAGGPWDLVIWQGENYVVPSTTLTALLNYVQGGGKLACTYWQQLTVPSDPLWAAMGFQYSSNDTAGAPAYWWDPGHPIFNSPESAPEWLVRLARSGTSQGTYIEPLANGIALGGYTTTPAPNQACLVLRDDGKTIYKALRDLSSDADADTDGVPDAVELWENIISGLINGFDVPWLDENPKTGTVTAGNSVDVDVTYDATGLAPGIYEATVSFTNDTPYGPLNVPVTLTVVEPVVPVATASVTSGTAPLTVNFTGTATGGIGTYSYDWDFGDGSPHSTAQNPSHTYNIGGSFTVTLTVTASVTGSGVDNHLVIAVTPPAIPVVNNFTDDAPRSLEQACFNRLTGAYVWTVTSGVHSGTVFTGTASVFNGGAKFTNKPADPNKFSVVYDPVKHKASGWLISGGVYYPLADSNTTNNPPGCY